MNDKVPSFRSIYYLINYILSRLLLIRGHRVCVLDDNFHSIVSLKNMNFHPIYVCAIILRASRENSRGNVLTRLAIIQLAETMKEDGVQPLKVEMRAR